MALVVDQSVVDLAVVAAGVGEKNYYQLTFMTHCVCTGGCGGVSDQPGVCQTENCPRHGTPLQECDCEDGEHSQETEERQEE